MLLVSVDIRGSEVCVPLLPQTSVIVHIDRYSCRMLPSGVQVRLRFKIEHLHNEQASDGGSHEHKYHEGSSFKINFIINTTSQLNKQSAFSKHSKASSLTSTTTR